MIELPREIRTQYRTATTKDVRAWSFGALTATRLIGAEPAEYLRGTLSDQAIFGPMRDYECACGLFRGIKYKGMMCHKCGVKITTADSRRARHGHVELPSTVHHPLGEPSNTLDAFSVVPAAYFESVAGGELADAYDRLLTACLGQDSGGIQTGINRITELLIPIFIEAHRWNLRDAAILARGLGLECRGPALPCDWLCETCGYPLTGLKVESCPGCGRKLSG